MKKICVFSGANLGIRKEYAEGAILLGRELVHSNIDLVYGGSSSGLMGKISNEILENGGHAIGIIPEILLVNECINKNSTKIIKVKNMSQRKEKMLELSDGFIAMPGGLGTYEELFDIISWARLKIHEKPIGVLNISGFFNPLLHMIEISHKEGFINKNTQQLFKVSENPHKLITMMKSTHKHIK